MNEWPRGYAVWRDHVEGESPEELHNRLMAELIDTADEVKQELAARIDEIADALDTIAQHFEERATEAGKAVTAAKQNMKETK